MLMGLGHPGRQMLAAKAAPSLGLDFTSGVLDPRITFVRNTVGTYYDSTGIIQTAGNNVPRFDVDPTSGRFNYVRNSLAVGSVPGTPGTAPTNWIVANPVGLTVTLGAVTTVGGIPVLPVTITGTATGSGSVSVVNDSVPASTGQVWTGSYYLQLVSGSFPHAVNLEIDELIAPGGGFLAGSVIPLTPTSVLTRFTGTRTFNQVNTGLVRLLTNIIITNGDVVNVTFNIGMPQLEVGSTATAPIGTSGVALGAGMVPRGLMIEPQVTNIFTQSGDFNNAAWNKGACTVSSAVQAPDGTNTARGLISNSGTIGNINQAFTPAAGTTYTVSVFMKPAATVSVSMLFPSGYWADATNRVATFTLTGNGSISSVTGGTASATIIPVSGGWYRCSMTATPDTAALGNTQAMRATANGDGTTVQMYGWGAQLEAIAFPTSYIPTTATSVTRAIDSAIMSASPWLDPNRGSVGALVTLNGWVPGAARNCGVFSLDDGAGTRTNSIDEFLSTGIPNSSASPVFTTRVASSNTGQIAPGGQTVGVAPANVGISCSWGAVNMVMSLNGAAPQSSAVSAIPSLSRLTIGNGYGGLLPLEGWIKRLRYWPRELSVAELRNESTYV